MHPDVKIFLHDVLNSCRLLNEFTMGKSLENYSGDKLLQSAVERQFLIIGEALGRALKVEPDLLESISNIRRIINFRNILVHGYSSIEDETVWGIIENDLPVLCSTVQKLLS